MVAMVIILALLPYLLRLHTRAIFVLPMLPADPKLFYFCAMFIYKKGTEKCVSLFRFIDY